MKRVILPRIWRDDNQSTGALMVVDDNGQPLFINPCVERGWQDNQRNISSIPEGEYPLVWEYSDKFKRMLWEIKDVPNRSECKIHPVNFSRDLNGCVAPGQDLVDIDKDGYMDVTDSRNTLKKFHKALEGMTETTIQIIDLYV